MDAQVGHRTRYPCPGANAGLKAGGSSTSATRRRYGVVLGVTFEGRREGEPESKSKVEYDWMRNDSELHRGRAKGEELEIAVRR